MELFQLMGTIAIDSQQANKAIDDTTKKAKTSENEVSGAFKKIGSVAGTIAKGIGVAGAALGGAWVAAIEGTREYRVSMGKLETAFTTAGHSADTAQATYSDLNAVIGDSDVAVEASSHLALLVDNEEDLSTWTNICTGIFATFGDSLPIEGLTEAANETAKTGILTGGLTDALNWAGIQEEKFQEQLDACTTEQERQNLIMDTLDSTYKKAAETYKETNKDVIEAEKANERLTKAMAEVGAVGEPILTAVKNSIADMATAAIPHVQSLVDKFMDLVKWVKENGDTINTWIGVIVGAAGAIGTFLLILNWGAIMKAAANAVKVVRTAILGMNAAMMANPIGLVVALIVGLVAAFMYLWKTSDSFRAFWIKIWNTVKTAASNAKKDITKVFSNIGTWFRDKFKAVQDAGKSAMDGVKKFFGDANTRVKGIWNGIGTWFKSKAAAIRDGFSSAISSIPEKAQEIFQRVKTNISNKIGEAREAVKTAIDKIKGFFKFKWSLPKLKMPKISTSGKFGLAPPSVPKFSLKWNQAGGILTEPTIFGMSGNTLLGGGEAGLEAVAPIETLKKYIDQSVRDRNTDLVEAFEIQISRLLSFMQEHFPTEYKIMLDTGNLAGALAPEMNARLADIYRYDKRTNTR